MVGRPFGTKPLFESTQAVEPLGMNVVEMHMKYHTNLIEIYWSILMQRPSDTKKNNVKYISVYF